MAPTPRAQVSQFSPIPSKRTSHRTVGRAIREYMVRAPHSIGVDQTLATAHEMMRKHRIRHLPVLRAGRLVGMLSQRDLYLVETLRDVEPERVRVDDAMSPNVYGVSPRASLGAVAQEMARHKYGCAVVMEKGKVIGIFTTTDALGVLARILEEKA